MVHTMDPLSLGAAEAQAQVSRNAVSLTRWGYRQLRLLGTYSIEWLMHDGSDLRLTATDRDDLTLFLASSRVRPIISLLATLVLLEQENSPEVGIARDALRSEALKWTVDHKNEWMAQFDSLWFEVLSTLSRHSSHLNLPAETTREIEEYHAFVESPASVSERVGFVQDLLTLFGDMSALLAADTLAKRVCEALSLQRLPPIISHSETEPGTADFEQLYVQRSLLNRRGGDERDAETLTAPGKGFRIVLRGNPGAGKTTFVRHLTWHLARPTEHGVTQPAIVIRCREYFSRGWTGSIVDYLSSILNAELGIRAAPSELHFAILLGKFVVIFDGLDEITEIESRSNFVARLEAFANAYPTTSILVTSREVGYTRAPISEQLFEQYSLREFTEEQVHEYATNWFGARDADSLIEPFMSDSESISEIRSNPLLLSLLCILYRARGAIPRRRRDIYGRCADLLFITWDAHRQISQPEELPAYGTRLMQEIALWVYKSRAAQGGIEEQVIEKVVSIYLADIGIAEADAQVKAREFLEFCAGRAWLLGAQGTSESGQRVFGFTHRTFYEYFAAEALSRSVRDASELYGEMVKAHTNDATSVLPELLLQAYEERVAHGARDVLRMACREKGSAALILRLMNGSLFPVNVRRGGFDEVLRQWREERARFTEETFDALFSLDLSAMRQFDTDYCETDASARELFSSGWCFTFLSGQHLAYSVEVSDIALKAISRVVADAGNAALPPTVRNWIFASMGEPPTRAIDEYLAIDSFNRRVPGALWLRLSGLIHESRPAEEVAVRRMLDEAYRGNSVSFAVGQMLAAVADEIPHYLEFITEMPDLSELTPAWSMVLETLTMAGMIIAEVEPESDTVLVELPAAAGTEATVHEMLLLRRQALDDDPEPAPEDVNQSVLRLLSHLPPVFSAWCEGGFSFCANPSEEWEQQRAAGRIR